jgi:uncharacterized membrane protein
MKFKRFGYFSSSLLVGLAALLFLNNSCKHDGIPAEQMTQISFTEVQPIYNSYCGRCHSGGNGDQGRLDLTTYTGILSSVTPGNSSKSKSYQAMTSTFQIMPPDIAMPKNERTLIRLWIDQGAKEN